MYKIYMIFEYLINCQRLKTQTCSIFKGVYRLTSNKKYIISFRRNSCGKLFTMKIYDIEKLPQNGFEDIDFIMKFWKDK